MARFQSVCEILDEAVGGPDAIVGFHGAVDRYPETRDMGYRSRGPSRPRWRTPC